MRPHARWREMLQGDELVDALADEAAEARLRRQHPEWAERERRGEELALAREARRDAELSELYKTAIDTRPWWRRF